MQPLVTEHPSDTVSRPLAMHLSVRLRELRARRGLTQDQVAKSLGCHESAVSRWESGSRFPTGEDLVKLADLFQVSTDDLLGRTRLHTPPGSALVDVRMLEKLFQASTIEEFDRIVEANQDHTIWLPVPDGATVMGVKEAMEQAAKVAEKFRGSRYADRLFRPRL